MNALTRILFSGFVISFIGTLPLGTLNTTAFQIAASENISEAFLFATAVIIVELIIVRITLLGANSINLNSKFFSYIMPAAIAMLIYLSASNFISASSQQNIHTSSSIFPMIKSSFTLGLIMSLLNPMHVPFWMGWNSVLKNRNTLQRKPGMYSSYITGIAVGSVAGLMPFILAGKFLITNYQQYSFIISCAMGILYLGFALYLLFRFYKNYPGLVLRLKNYDTHKSTNA